MTDQGAIPLTARMFEYVQMIEQFTGQPTGLRLSIAERAVTIAAALADHTPSPAAEILARDICQLMHPGIHPPAEFWATDLGADVAWHIGYPYDDVPLWAAAAVLRYNRITIWRLRKQEPVNAKRLRELTRSRNP